jgi:hypothetical protein
MAEVFSGKPPDDYFGCPQCGRGDGYVNICSTHYGTCDTCKVWWRIGVNLFGCWRDEAEPIWERNRTLLAQYCFVGDPGQAVPREEIERALHEQY